MKMKLRNIILLILTLSVTRLSAQQTIDGWHQPVRKGIESLTIGDNAPNFKIEKIFNGNVSSAMLDDYRDRLVIFDFGNTTCGGCIAALPRMDSLEKQFGARLRIFWVTYEKKEDVARFWKRSKLTQHNKLQTIVEDSTLAAYFPHRTWPHEAWVYKGRVIAITEPDYVDAANIKKVLDGQQINWPVKNDFYAFDGTKECLFTIDSDQVNAHSPLKYAAISDYKEGVNAGVFSGGSGIVRDSIHHTIRAFFLNQLIFNTYWMNYINGRLMPENLVKPQKGFQMVSNEIEWEVSDKNKYTYISKAISGYEQEYEQKHSICFESLNPDTGQTDQQVYKSINDDLDRLLGLKAGWEKRNEKVLVLVRTTTDDRIKSQQTIVNSIENIHDGVNPHEIIKDYSHRFRDISLASLIYQLNVEGNPYVFDETGYKDHVDLDLEFANWNDIAAIRKGLQKYGLDLKEEERLVDKFVFAEVNGGLMIDGAESNAAKARRDAQKGMKNPDPNDNALFLKNNKSKAGVITLPSGLQYKIIKQGTGPVPALTDKVSVNYTGTLVNGKIFDSSLETGRPATFSVSQVIPGWTEALQRMPTGSKWMLYIPAELAYGPHTNQGAIPPNSTLVFEIELLNVVK